MSAWANRHRPATWLRCCVWAGVWWAAGHACGAEEPAARFEFLQIRMGVSVGIQVYADDAALANQAADAAYARFKELDRILSDYDPDSELMRLCAKSGPGLPVAVSADLGRVMQWSQALAEQSEGAFDVTVGPTVNLWRIARRKKVPPDPDQLRDALSRVGYRKLVFDPEARTAELRVTGMRLDLGGIAVGYAVDEAMAIFRSHGLTRVLIDASGDIAVGDPPPGRETWRIEIEPLQDGLRPRQTLELKNCAVTTSGDTSKFVEFDGVRYSHIVDPRTGYGLTRRTSATVIAPDCITADSVATTVNVLGPERGLEFIPQLCGVEASIEYVQDDGSVATLQSPEFAALLAAPSQQ